MARVCICGRQIPFDETEAPVAMLDPIKFYRNGSEFGHPTSRQKAFTCGSCTDRLIAFLRELEESGPGPREGVG